MVLISILEGIGIKLKLKIGIFCGTLIRQFGGDLWRTIGLTHQHVERIGDAGTGLIGGGHLNIPRTLIVCAGGAGKRPTLPIKEEPSRGEGRTIGQLGRESQGVTKIHISKRSHIQLQINGTTNAGDLIRHALQNHGRIVDVMDR